MNHSSPINQRTGPSGGAQEPKTAPPTPARRVSLPPSRRLVPIDELPEALEPGAFVQALEAEALRHRAVKHPYLWALAEGTFPDETFALEDFARQYIGYSSRFPSYLRAVISRLEDETHRAMLGENLVEESGEYGHDEVAALEACGLRRGWFEGIPHPQLFRRFASALGLDSSSEGPAPQVEQWSDAFLSLLETSSAAGALGAIGLGTENIVGTIYQPFVAACKRCPKLSQEDSVFFSLHATVDEDHQATLREITEAHATSPEAREAIRAGMLAALGLRASFWDWLYKRALKPDAHRR